MNLLLKVRARTVRELELLLKAITRQVPGVQRTEAMVVMSSAKETFHLPVTPPPERS